MFCVNCGAEVPNETKFCPYCGSGLQSGTVEPNINVNRNDEQVYYVPVKRKPHSVLSVLMFLSSLLSLIVLGFSILFVYGGERVIIFILTACMSLAGCVFGILDRRKVMTDDQYNHSLSMGAIVLGIIGLVAIVFFWIVP